MNSLTCSIPFNPEIKFMFNVDKASPVRIDIYNIMGQHIITLENSVKRAGNYMATWDASFETSGIYFVKATINNKIFTKKIILMNFL